MLLQIRPSVRLSVRPQSNAGTVSKRVDISSQFLDILAETSFYFFEPQRRYKIPKASPLLGALNAGSGIILQISLGSGRR